MISAESVKQTVIELFGNVIPAKCNFEKIAQELNDYQERYGIKLSEYGFAKFMFDLYGVKSLYTTMGISAQTVQKYAETAVRIRDDMPSLLLNCSKYVQKLFNVITDTDLCFKQLEGMTFPYVMYVLFAGSGKDDLVERYADEFNEQMMRYPSTLDKLPQQFRLAEETENADTEER